MREREYERKDGSTINKRCKAKEIRNYGGKRPSPAPSVAPPLVAAPCIIMSDDDVAAAPSSFSCLSPALCCILPLTAQSWIVYLTFSCFLAVEMRAACASFCPLASKSCQLEWGNFPSFVGRRLLLPLFLVLQPGPSPPTRLSGLGSQTS